MTNDTLYRALTELDDYLTQLGGCSDGYCIIKRPVGMHTNGGCRCNTDKMKMQRYAYAMNKFADTVRALTPREPSDDLVERVAATMFNDAMARRWEGAVKPTPTWPMASPELLEEWRQHARAAIGAMVGGGRS